MVTEWVVIAVRESSRLSVLIFKPSETSWETNRLDGYKAGLINFGYITHAVLSMDDVVEAMQ
jgi:hypothetical protein